LIVKDPAVQDGLDQLSRMRGPAAAAAIGDVIDSEDFGSELGAFATEFAFARIWRRPGLDAKSRSLVTIGVLAGQGRLGELGNHLDAGLNHGLTVEELEEVLLQIAAYAGLPAAWSAFRRAQDVLAQRAAGATTAH
jgi:alkylhydroperoxidase/carboxymuconolactone decarboxylase family protein YurZ